ncbi:hypothetical protein FB45DRAFT_334185 [Roridomyces roridus]|uniref:DUF7726 domain-containing protein n=1 Tax=Roridomyces roridus TaxID=1738132 RepID=A0AAD7B4L7_9AGAR|nr:hypothetical protein FB45DRAFT_334185 [Roridomyces roridus]
MRVSFPASELPNPLLLTEPANIEFLKKQEEQDALEAAAKSTGKRRKADTPTTSKFSKKSKKDTGTDDDALFDITLDGDENAFVELYDTCDELRRKINKHLRTGITKAAFLRDIARAAYPTSPPTIQSKQLTDFLSKKGPTSGSTSRVCYASYVYFEKKRIAEGKGKSAHRKDMEDRWEGEGGMPRERPQKYICGVDQDIVQDRLGGVRAVPLGRF